MLNRNQTKIIIAKLCFSGNDSSKVGDLSIVAWLNESNVSIIDMVSYYISVFKRSSCDEAGGRSENSMKHEMLLVSSPEPKAHKVSL